MENIKLIPSLSNLIISEMDKDSFNGSEAKLMIRSGLVKVNGEVELRRGRKLRTGDIVEINDKKFQ